MFSSEKEYARQVVILDLGQITKTCLLAGTMSGIGNGSFGNIVDAPGPTSLQKTPFTVTVTAPQTGLYSFTLDYAECCGTPADLIFDVNNALVGTTPEPSSFILLGADCWLRPVWFAAVSLHKRRPTHV